MEIDRVLLALANVPDPPVNSALVISEPSDPPAALAAAEAELRARACSSPGRDVRGVYEQMGFREAAEWEVWVRSG
jgi:hypothetical protein